MPPFFFFFSPLSYFFLSPFSPLTPGRRMRQVGRAGAAPTRDSPSLLKRSFFSPFFCSSTGISTEKRQETAVVVLPLFSPFSLFPFFCHLPRAHGKRDMQGRTIAIASSPFPFPPPFFYLSRPSFPFAMTGAHEGNKIGSGHWSSTNACSIVFFLMFFSFLFLSFVLTSREYDRRKG